MRLSPVIFLMFGLLPLVSRADEPYFPDLVFDTDRESHNATAAHYGKHLKEMSEPSLLGLSRNGREAEAYRFLLLPCFYRPISVRVTRTGPTATLRAVQLDGMGGYEPGKIVFDKTTQLTQAQWESLRSRLEKSRFWSMKTGVELANPNFGNFVGNLDSDHWIVEGVKDGKYHVVDREEPEKDFEALGLYLLELSGLDLEAPYIPEQVLADDLQPTRPLKAMKEPSLFKRSKTDSAPVYRFLWLKSPGRSVALRIEQFGYDEDHRTTLYATRLKDGTTTRRDLKLGEQQWDDLVRRLGEIKFRRLSARDEKRGTGGESRLIVEGVDSGYRVIDRAVPLPPEVRDLLGWVLDLAGPEVRGWFDGNVP
jgi:hypothetical protein